MAVLLEVLEVLVTQTKAYDLEYIDCLHPQNIRRYQADKICETKDKNEETPTDITYTILQIPIARKIKGFSCRITVSTYYYKCGAWGHLKTAAVPKILHPKDVSTSECETMIRNQNYYLTGNSNEYVLEFNEETFVSVTTVGELKEKNDAVGCRGEDVHIGSNLHHNVVVLKEFRILIQKEDFLLSEDIVEVISDHVRLPCSYSDMGCTTGRATYIWTQQNVHCNLEIIQNMKPSKVMNTYMVDHNIQCLINITGTATLSSCPMTLLKTDHPRIFLAETSEVISLPTIDPSEVDIALQGDIHLNYVSYQLEREVERQKKSTIEQICKEQRHIANEDMEPLKLENNQYGIRKGDVYFVFSCEVKTAKIAELSSCYMDIPIEQGKFVKRESKQLVLKSTKIPCSKNFPTIVKSTQGWLEILPHLKPRPAPLEELPQQDAKVQYEDFSHGGLYSQTELQEWQHQVTFPNYHKALLKSITYGTCLQDGHCQTTGNANIQTYDLNHLIPTLEKEFDIWSKFKNFLKQWGDLMAFICLVVLGVKLLSDLVLISITTLRAGPAAAVALIASLYLYNRTTYQRIMRRHQKKHRESEEPQEQVPLHNI